MYYIGLCEMVWFIPVHLLRITYVLDVFDVTH